MKSPKADWLCIWTSPSNPSVSKGAKELGGGLNLALITLQEEVIDVDENRQDIRLCKFDYFL
jgi:hypothetical protein